MNKKFELTVFHKANGPLTKQISLDNGRVNADGAACKMAHGGARRVELANVSELAKLIGNMPADEALALGRLRPDLPDTVEVVPKKDLNGAPDVIARTSDFLHFAEQQAAFLLLDHDSKSMPREVSEKLTDGFWPAVIAAVPGLNGATCVRRRSTSAGLYRQDTGEQFDGSGNSHTYIAVTNGTDIERALKTLHQRLWLAGLGYYVVGAAGTLLERSIIDVTVHGPERLVFEGAPLIEPPLAQNAVIRRPQTTPGKIIDTAQAIPDLTAEETKRLADLQAEARRRLREAAAAARKAWAADFARRRGLSEREAEQIAHAAAGVHELAPEFELEFDELETCTVADVITDPERYVEQTLADPLEGISYGCGKAKVFKRYDGCLMIHSFAHGGINYRLQGQGVTLNDFYSVMEKAATYMFAPTRAMWPGSRVNTCVPPVPLVDHNGNPVLDNEGKPATIPATFWLDVHRRIVQLTWAPGWPEMIDGWLIAEGGWIARPGIRCFNLYRAPTLALGDASKAEPWIDLVHKVYPDEADWIIKFFAHRVQRPEEKINHALVLGGKPGIGKDSIIEPLKRSIGSWNFGEEPPQRILGTFTGFCRNVVLRISEGRDLGEFDRFKFYDRSKTLIAAPPDVLLVNEKHIKEYFVPNIVSVIITTNYLTDGIHLPADDRRHYVAWSELCEESFGDEDERKSYWGGLWRFYDEGGDSHVAAYLAGLDLSDFNPKAPPPKTAAFWSIADAGEAPETAELADVLDKLDNPDAVTLEQIQENADGDFLAWIIDRKNRRIVPHRFREAGFVPVRNELRKDKYWKINGKRQPIYAKTTLSQQQQLQAANELVERLEADNQEQTTE